MDYDYFFSSTPEEPAKESGDKEEGNEIKFDPPLYVQRYQFVINELRNDYDVIDQIVDFGCAECKFLRRARNCLSKYANDFIGVDVDGELLSKSIPSLKPEPDSPLEERPKTAVFLYKGSISEYDDRLRCCDAVVAIEVIEHLEQDTLAAFPRVIFERIQPYVAIFTTPNVEFNALFDMAGRRFRHDDHKFEWSRQEFHDWCSNIVKTYPDYDVTYDGVGQAPSGDPDEFGFCSQIAIFRLKHKRSYFQLKERKLREFKNQADLANRPYELVARIIDEPKFTPSRKWRVLSECQNFCLSRLDDATRTGGSGVLVPLNDLLHCSKYVEKLCMNVDVLMQILIDRDDCGWQFQIDLRNYQVYCENKPFHDDSEEDLDELLHEERGF